MAGKHVAWIFTTEITEGTELFSVISVASVVQSLFYPKYFTTICSHHGQS